MSSTYSTRQPENSKSLALLIIPPLQAREGNNSSLEATMQSLVLDKKYPVALELAGTNERRSFIIRATRQSALDHVEALLRSQYPQLEVRPLHTFEDPFRLEAHEAVSAVELQAGGASFLPLRTWTQNKQEQETIDPVLGLLTALSKLPAHTRVIAQIGLLPTPTDWSRKHMRKSIESPLDVERSDMARETLILRMYRDQWSTPALVIIGALVGLFALVRPLIPDWMWDVLALFIKGKTPQLTQPQILQLLAIVIGLIVGGICLFLLLEWIRSIVRPRSMYDPRMAAQKISCMAYRTCIRLYAIGPRRLSAQDSLGLWDELRAEREQMEVRQELLLRVIAVYRQFNQASGAYLVPRSISPAKAIGFCLRKPGKYGWTKGLSRSNHLLSVDALAALWHLPDISALPELALVEHRRKRTFLMPPEIAQESVGLTPIGYSEHGGYRLPFALTPQFFHYHTLIAGKSGEGKSTCMEHIAREAMQQGGLILIDPHGDLCDHVLHIVPEFRADDVVMIDLSDRDASVGINPLDVTLGRGRDKAISDLLRTLAHIWESAWGPRMENAFEMSLRTLFEANRILVAQDKENGPRQQYTLLDVLPLLTNEHFCQAILEQVDDDYLHRWWREYYMPLSLMQQRDVINPVITKIAKFESILARRIIGQSLSTLNFSQMIAEQKIILLKLAKGVIGADVAALLGATFLGLLQITLEEQGTKAERDRVRFPIILDEFQALAGVEYGALAELRKYGATFFLSTQSLEYLQKLDEFLLPTVLANVKQLIIFNLSSQDAETLYKELEVEPEDILNLDMHTCYLKMPLGNSRQPTFSVQIEPPPVGDMLQAESIRTRCRVRYTCSVDEVDRMLRDAMIRSICLAPTPKGRAWKPVASSPENNITQGKKKNHGRKSKERAAKFKQALQKEGALETQIDENVNDDEDQEWLEDKSLHPGKEEDGAEQRNVF